LRDEVEERGDETIQHVEACKPPDWERHVADPDWLSEFISF